MKTWIDERPFEDIVQTTLCLHAYKEEVEDILLRIDIDEQFQFKCYKSNNTYTLYDGEILSMKRKKTELETEVKTVSKKFEDLCLEYGTLADKEDPNFVEKEKGEEDEVDVEQEVVGQKDFKANKKGKPSTAEEKEKEKLAIQKRIQQLKNSMANTQDKLISLQSEVETVNEKIATFEHNQKITRLYLRYMKTLVETYEKNRNREFLVKGIYNAVQYTDMMIKRFVYSS